MCFYLSEFTTTHVVRARTKTHHVVTIISVYVGVRTLLNYCLLLSTLTVSLTFEIPVNNYTDLKVATRSEFFFFYVSCGREQS
jgi:hypothetical protein